MSGNVIGIHPSVMDFIIRGHFREWNLFRIFAEYKHCFSLEKIVLNYSCQAFFAVGDAKRRCLERGHIL